MVDRTDQLTILNRENNVGGLPRDPRFVTASLTFHCIQTSAVKIENCRNLTQESQRIYEDFFFHSSALQFDFFVANVVR